MSTGGWRKGRRPHDLGRAGVWAIRFAGVFIGLNLLYVVLLTLACALPATPGFRRHMKEASKILFAETEYPKIGPVKLDNFTDSIVLDIVYSVDPAHPFRSAMAGVRTRYVPNKRPLPTFYHRFIDRDARQFTSENYFRYWHGYLVLWRPLMMAWGYNDIRMLNSYVAMLLMAGLVIGIYRRAGGWPAFALVTGLASMQAWIMPLSLPYMPGLLIALAGGLAGLAWARTGYGRQAMLLMIIGSVTAYIDLLSGTVMTLGIPLLVLMAAGDGRKRSMQALGLPVFWAAGWAGTWMAKFMLAMIFFEGAAQNIWDTVVFRLSARPSSAPEAVDISRGLALQLNLQEMVLKNRGLLWVAAVVLVGMVAWKWGLKRRGMPVLVREAWAYLVVGLFPFAWYALLANHSYIHKFMMYRLLAIPLMAVLLFLSPAEKREEA